MTSHEWNLVLGAVYLGIGIGTIISGAAQGYRGVAWAGVLVSLGGIIGIVGA